MRRLASTMDQSCEASTPACVHSVTVSSVHGGRANHAARVRPAAGVVGGGGGGVKRVGVGVGEEQSRAVVRRGGAQDSAQHGVYAPAPPCKASKHVCAGPYAPPSGGEEKE